jgi:hypothetical protein
VGDIVGDEHEMFSSGLSRSQLERLTALTHEASGKSVDTLQAEVNQHLDRTQAAHQRSRIVNLRLATAIGETIGQVLQQWDSLSANSRNWLAGGFLYFTSHNDDEPDFDSPIGFEDDTEVLNACLRFAELNDLCLNAEDYDDA